jgi:predicted CopG family antitoxin
MVKTLNIAFDNVEYDELIDKKPEDLSWREWILKLAGVKKKTKVLKDEI